VKKKKKPGSSSGREPRGSTGKGETDERKASDPSAGCMDEKSEQTSTNKTDPTGTGENRRFCEPT